MQIRNRIKAHCRVRASDLVPHEFNYRYHPGNQIRTLQALYQEIGFARSLLAYQLPDGRLNLIESHLGPELAPNMVVEVEVLDVTDEEARAPLLSIDPVPASQPLEVAFAAALAEIQSSSKLARDLEFSSRSVDSVCRDRSR
jgi:hypothetical protein